MNQEKEINQKSKIPIIFFVFFAVIFAVDFAYIIIANKSWKGVVIDKNIAKNLNYQSVVAQEEIQKSLGWQVLFEHKIVEIENNKSKIKFLVKIDQQKNASQINLVTVNLSSRNNNNSSNILLDMVEKNVFVGTTSTLKKGKWQARLKINASNNLIYNDLQEIIL